MEEAPVSESCVVVLRVPVVLVIGVAAPGPLVVWCACGARSRVLAPSPFGVVACVCVTWVTLGMRAWTALEGMLKTRARAF